MRYLRILIICIIPLSLILGCGKLPIFKKGSKAVKKTPSEEIEVTGTIIAKVNNIPITLEELNEQIENINKLAVEQGRPQDKIDTREKKIKYLKEELIRQKLLYQEALDRGLDKRDEVKKAFYNVKVSLLISELIKDELGKIDVTSSEIEEYYNRYKDQFREPEERKISEIVTNTEEEAKQVVINYLQGQDFASLAKQHSKTESASKGGDLGYLKIETPEKRIRFDKFYEVAFSPSLEVGQVSNPFKGPDGWYIIKLEAKKEGKQRSLNDMWGELKNGLQFLKQQQRVEEIIGQLQSQAKIEILEDKVY